MWTDLFELPVPYLRSSAVLLFCSMLDLQIEPIEEESMPVGTLRLGGNTDISKLAALLWMLVDNPDVEDSSVASSTLAECDVDAAGVLDLWAAVCEKFGENARPGRKSSLGALPRP